MWTGAASSCCPPPGPRLSPTVPLLLPRDVCWRELGSCGLSAAAGARPGGWKQTTSQNSSDKHRAGGPAKPQPWTSAVLTGCGARVPLAQGLAGWDSVTQKLGLRWLPAVREVWQDGCRGQGWGGDSTAGWQGAWGPLLKPGPVGGAEGQQGWRGVAGSLASPEHLKGSEVGVL